MAAAGTLTKLSTSPDTSSFALTFSHFQLVISEATPTGPKEVRRFKYADEASATEAGFQAQKAGFGVDVVEVFARHRVSGDPSEG